MIKHNVNRMQVTHTGSLPRPPALLSLMLAREQGEVVDPDVLDAAVRLAVTEVVKHQVDVGITLINDGEQSKPSYATYMKDRLHGFGGELASNTSFGTGALPEDFPAFFANRPRLSIRRPSCDGPVSWKDFAAVQKDIENFKAALADIGVEDAFMSAASPGVIPVFLPNGYYPTDEAYLYALADVMQQEYEAMVQAGFTLQLDCPDLAMTRGGLSIEAFRKLMTLRLEVLNYAVRNIPPEQMRMHVCWGNSAAPHTRDPELREIVDLLLTARPLGLSFVGANPRHEHEWSVWRDVKLPVGKVLIPGVVDSTTNIVEHPDLVAERLVRYASVVGRENVIAGTDCGFGTSVRQNPLVDPEIAWAKLAAMADGARRATQQLWGRTV
jgi:5-methyltetrahydropteroyltriglutamate--homocysteine methyltransferase